MKGKPTALQVFPDFETNPNGQGSELNYQGTAGFGPGLHLPGFHVGVLPNQTGPPLLCPAFSPATALLPLPTEERTES